MRDLCWYNSQIVTTVDENPTGRVKVSSSRQRNSRLEFVEPYAFHLAFIKVSQVVSGPHVQFEPWRAL